VETWDVVVVGCGAAGLLAVGAAARAGARVLGVEKMHRGARKVGIAGKGRCNVTNDKPLELFLEGYRSGGEFLRGAFSRFFSHDIIEILERRGAPCVVERGGRIFPKSGQAGDVVQALYRYARTDGGAVRVETEVVGVDRTDAGFAVRFREGAAAADRVILATGGKSYPRTGSTGDGCRFAARLGHRLIAPRPALTPITIDTGFAPFEANLHNVRLTLRDGDRTVAEGFGDALFSHDALGGAVPVDLSRDVDGLANPALSIDFKPALDEAKLDARLQRDLNEHGKEPLAVVLNGLLPKAVIPLFVQRLKLDPQRKCAEISRATRRALGRLCKDFAVKVMGVRGWDEAIITVGGVALDEVDPRTMESKLVPGLYICGELLDVDGVTGGYNLQAAFSTGFVAGDAAARKRA
jgi:predicted Rossmann fold flavoprotein